MKFFSVTTEMKATEQYFPVVLFITLYKVVLTFESVDEILWCDHSNESYWMSFPVVLFIMLYKVALTLFKGRLLSRTILWCRSRAWPFACLAFCSTDYRKKRDCSWSKSESVNKILWWNHSNKSLQAGTFPWCCILYMYFTRWFKLLTLWMKS